MPRTRKNRGIQKRMCERFVTLLRDHLSMSEADAARALGYHGTATLWKIRHGLAFLDVEKLARLASLGQSGARPNLHWLISGEGPPLVPITPVSTEVSKVVSQISLLSAEERHAVMTLIRSRVRPRRTN